VPGYAGHDLLDILMYDAANYKNSALPEDPGKSVQVHPYWNLEIGNTTMQEQRSALSFVKIIIFMNPGSWPKFDPLQDYDRARIFSATR